MASFPEAIEFLNADSDLSTLASDKEAVLSCMRKLIAELRRYKIASYRATNDLRAMMAKLNIAERDISSVDSPDVGEILNKDQFKCLGFNTPMACDSTLLLNSVEEKVCTRHFDAVEK